MPRIWLCATLLLIALSGCGTTPAATQSPAPAPTAAAPATAATEPEVTPDIEALPTTEPTPIGMEQQIDPAAPTPEGMALDVPGSISDQEGENGMSSDEGVSGDTMEEPGNTGEGFAMPGAPPTGDSEPGIEGGGSEPFAPPSAWLTYTDPAYGFAINYPDTYVLLDNGPTINAEGLIHQVHFQDQVLADSDTADLQPPAFSIEVYESPANTTLEQWIRADLAPEDTVTPTRIGGRNGYIVQWAIEIAPNRFYYVADDQYFYKLTPLGPYGEEMIETFVVR